MRLQSTPEKKSASGSKRSSSRRSPESPAARRYPFCASQVFTWNCFRKEWKPWSETTRTAVPGGAAATVSPTIRSISR